MKTRGKKNQFDPFIYAAYIPDEETIYNIEQRFLLLEQEKARLAEKGTNDEEVARRVFAQTAQPNQLPLEVWLAVDDNILSNNYQEEDDQNFIPQFGDEEDEFIPRFRREYGGAGKKSKKKGDTMANSGQIEHLGAGVDLWPAHKVSHNINETEVIKHREFPNSERIVKMHEFRQQLNSSLIYDKVDNITVELLLKYTDNKKIDAIIMDPPFGHNGWTIDHYKKFITNLKPYLSQTFIVTWADPDYLDGIISTINELQLVFCDSLCIELLDNFERPYIIGTDEFGFARDSRMAIMFRTDDITRCDLRQQRVKDTGFGVVYPGGKTYGRISMPMTIHNNIEVMLPPKKGVPRTFIELWPTHFSGRKGWIMIDEIEVEE